MSKYLGLLSVACAAIAMPVMSGPAHAAAWTAADSYCSTLSKHFKRYIPGPPLHQNMVGDVAVAQCKESTPGPAIPVLEHEIVRSKLPLPPRPAAAQQAELVR